jgi:hypothetical protein
MGEINRVDSFAMEAVAEYLLTAASDIGFACIDWAEQQDDSPTSAIDLHAESARLWTASVVERLEAWAKRARETADALERHQLRRLR